MPKNLANEEKESGNLFLDTNCRSNIKLNDSLFISKCITGIIKTLVLLTSL